jgi:hypothetical protein
MQRKMKNAAVDPASINGVRILMSFAIFPLFLPDLPHDAVNRKKVTCVGFRCHSELLLFLEVEELLPVGSCVRVPGTPVQRLPAG